jgi:hypothetical protein
MKKRVLVSWIGRSDLAQMGRERGGELEALVKAATSWNELLPNSSIKAIICNEQFEAIHLLSDFGEEMGEKFKEWLGMPVTIHRVNINAWDFTSVFTVADKMLGDIIELYRRDKYELCLHLSTGTHTMVAVLLLLGCTHYPATFYQTIQGKSSQAVLPFELDLFIRKRLLEEDRSWTRIAFESAAEVPGFENLLGKSKPFLEAVDVARRAAPHSMPVLLLGESGVGKELFARAIHNASGREKDKFVAVNCSAIPFELFEAEMFGAIRGAGSQVAERGGYFKAADNATLFLDEIGDMAFYHQAKLLRVIESYEKGESPTVMRVNVLENRVSSGRSTSALWLQATRIYRLAT